MRPLLLLVALTGCDLADLGTPGLPPPSGGGASGGGADSGDPGAAVAFEGFIGAPCETDRDCDGALICLEEGQGFPGGSCSEPCDALCPDADGAPVTFCVDAAALPASVHGDIDDIDAIADIDDGACLSRCDFGAFPRTGCRDGYGCTEAARPYATAGDETFVCLPGRPATLSACHDALAARDAPFEPTVRPTERPPGEPGLTCEIDDPVWLLGELEGLSLSDPTGTPTPRVLTSCEAALALADTARDLASQGVVGIRHWGSYSCRTISGTRTLSQHAYADAFDLTGFERADGSLVTLVDHWEHDTARPRTEGGAMLLDAALRWHRRGIWNTILTPNYNLAHDDHFHVDLTPGADVLGATDGRFVGTAPYVD